MLQNNTVKIKIKRSNNKDKPIFSIEEHKELRNWLYTGSFDGSTLYSSGFDKSKINLVKRFCNASPSKVSDILEEAYKRTLNKQSVIFCLVLLSNSGFRGKRIFKDFFERVIVSGKDLYTFMNLCKNERGMGSLIKDAVSHWFKSKDIHKLEKIFIRDRYGSNWKVSDVMKVIRPKPADKKENLLYKWLSNNVEEIEDYKEVFPLIYIYEKMKFGTEELAIEAVREYGFRNNMIPSNVARTERLAEEIFVRRKIDQSIVEIGRYLNRLEVSERLARYFEENEENITLSSLKLLSAYSKIKNCMLIGNSFRILNVVERSLINKIKKTHDNYIHVVDTSNYMLDDKLDFSEASSAITSSVLIGASKQVVSTDGSLFNKRTPRMILEAEGYNVFNKILIPNYTDIFRKVSEFEGKVMIVWTNNKNFDKVDFNREFQKFKTNNQRVMKIVFVNLNKERNKSAFRFIDIYKPNQDIDRLLKYIKEGLLWLKDKA